MSFLSTVISQAKNTVMSGTNSLNKSAQSALNELARGNFEGALNSIANAPEDAVNTLGSNGSSSPGNYFSGINARGDALQNWCWYCLLPTISNNNSVDLTGGFLSFLATESNPNPSLKPAVALPWYYVQTASLPQRTFQADSVNMNGHPVHFPESYSVGNLTLGLFMDNTNKAQEWLKAWQGQIMSNQDPTNPTNQGMWGLPAQYKKTINIVVLDVKQSRMLDVKYINCWPADPNALELVSGQAEGLVQNISLMVEDVEISVFNDKGVVDTVVNTAQGYALGALSGFAGSQLNSAFKSFFS